MKNENGKEPTEFLLIKLAHDHVKAAHECLVDTNTSEGQAGALMTDILLKYLTAICNCNAILTAANKHSDIDKVN